MPVPAVVSRNHHFSLPAQDLAGREFIRVLFPQIAGLVDGLTQRREVEILAPPPLQSSGHEFMIMDDRPAFEKVLVSPRRRLLHLQFRRHEVLRRTHTVIAPIRTPYR